MKGNDLSGDIKQREAFVPFVFAVVSFTLGLATLPAFLKAFATGSSGSLLMLLTVTAIPGAIISSIATAFVWVSAMNLPRTAKAPIRDACALMMLGACFIALAFLSIWPAQELLAGGILNGRRLRGISLAESPITAALFIALFTLGAAASVWGAWRQFQHLLSRQ